MVTLKRFPVLRSVVFLSAALLASSTSSATSATSAASAASTTSAQAEPTSEPDGSAGTEPVDGALLESPAPSFSLTTLAGTEVSSTTYSGYITVLYFLPRIDLNSLVLGDEIEFFKGKGRPDEIRYLGISSAPEEDLRNAAAQKAWTHDVATDPGGEAMKRFLGSSRLAVIVVDHHGVVRFFSDTIDTSLPGALRDVLRELLRELGLEMASLPRPETRWRERPRAPMFSAQDLEGKTRTSAEFQGKPLLVYFFEADCIACDESSAVVRDALVLQGKNGLQIVGVMTQTEREAAAAYVRQRGLKFPILLDSGGEIRRRFGATAGVPDLYWFDDEGGLRWRELGSPEGVRDLVLLRASVLTGTANPDSLLPGRYVGFRTCRTCHESQYQDWMRTPHAVAGQSVNGNRVDICLSCHVTGLNEPGGHSATTNPGTMFQVQCEACHGPGGGHGQQENTPSNIGNQPWEARCIKCHMGPYELEQPYEESYRWMEHRNTPDAATLFAYLPERREDSDRFLAARETVTGFRPGTSYVGSPACAACHATIYERWREGPHASALETLREQGDHENRDCLGCHVTAPGLLVGYRGPSTPGLAGVGCESCHGPGGDHVGAPEPLRDASIYGLTPDCADCLPEATCRSCHDLVNDPDFQMPEGTYHRKSGKSGKSSKSRKGSR